MSEPEHELDVARGIAAGSVPSPYPFAGSMFVAARASGVGCAWRAKHQEYVWREPDIWTSPEMLERLRGVPLLINHPESGVLDGTENALRNVGCTVFSFVRDGEPWIVGRIVDQHVADAIKGGMTFDTSPSAVFGADDNIRLELDGGDVLVVEASPVSIDHLAMLPLPDHKGVWGAGRNAEPGVEVTNGGTHVRR
jgi:hypothetical protein